MKSSSQPIFLLPQFEKFIQASSSGKRITPSGKRLASGTIEQYRIVYKLLYEFEEKTESILRIKLIHRSSLRELQKEKAYWKRFFRNFCNYMLKTKGYYDQYAGSVFKTIKTFFNYLNNEKALPVGSFHKQFRLPVQKLTPVVLEPQQLQHLIINEEFHYSLPKYLQRTKDIFVFGCTVGLRFIDLMSLRKRDIQYTDRGNQIVFTTRKTNTEVKIPLPDYIMEIVNKYKRLAGKFILPRLSSTNMNKQVKMIIEKAGWVYNLPKIRNRQGRPLQILNHGECLRFCDHITSHTMRRTAITTLLLMGVPETMVRRISGHGADSRDFYKYVAVVQDYLNENVRMAFDKLITLNHLKVG